MPKKSYYLFNPGELSRKDNSLSFNKGDDIIYLPINEVENLYIFGNINCNSNLFYILNEYNICCHWFDYYEHYVGSFLSKEYLLSGKLLIKQSEHYIKNSERIFIAKNFIKASINNCLLNLNKFKNEKLDEYIFNINKILNSIDNYNNIQDIMGIEGNCRKIYYDSFNTILNKYQMNGRTKQPPKDEINCLLSFGNMMCYALCLDQIYHTQLNPTISYLHEPGERRFSLSLDLAEIFKPLIVDRIIFRLINNNQLKDIHFDKNDKYCLLNDEGKKIFCKEFDEEINKIFLYKKNKKICYKSLIKLECYKLIKHLLGIETYKPFIFY